MSEATEKWSDKLSGQYKQLNKNLDKMAKAGKGLFARAKKAGTRQFNDLVEVGEKTDSDILNEVKNTVKQPFNDIRGSVNKAKFASVGLFVLAKENGNRYFDELVNEGEKSERPKTQKNDTNKSKPKNSNSKAA